MKKLLGMLVFAGLLFAAAPAALRAQDDDHGRHRGWYKHGDDDDDQGYRHDNGWHKGWYKHHDRGDDDWDDDGGRVRYYYSRVPYPYVRHVIRSEEHTSELQSRPHLVCRLLLEK